MPALNIFKRVNVCNEMPTYSESVDVFLDSSVFARLVGDVPVEIA